ncbi:MAG: single-stranded DNA-binding protein, partial [Acidobacteriota bacterium]|nr:single-stranded DNA-binding protein [Acidobacteriota bacterium]
DKRDGQKRQTTEIVGTTMRMLGSRGEGSGIGSGAGRGADAETEAAMPSEEPAAGPEISDEDIPF